VISLVLWAVTSSAFALVFALLGPVTAVAGLVDSRVSARRLTAREAARFGAEVRSTLDTIADRHAAERAALDEAHPSAARLTARRGADPYRWSASRDGTVLVTLGRGSTTSALELGAALPAASGHAELESLMARAAVIDGAPVLVDARFGIGVCGPLVVAAAVARGIVVQLAWTLSPTAFWIARPDDEWAAPLPHQNGPLRSGYLLEWGALGDDAPIAGIAIADNADALPGSCRVVVALRDGVASILEHPDRTRRSALAPEALSRESARAWAMRVRADAVREQVILDDRAPGAVALAPLLRLPGTGDSLACEVGRRADGPLTLDLIEHGPHAIIGGTTGSGKSELLVAWVVAMAAARSPEVVTFLLVDFKGGASFAPLKRLPHAVGIITDLDASEADRALRSLRAELRYRERIVAGAHGASLGEVPLPRLVIVVDEFAALVAESPDLHAVFADIAARGRSLGMHLVLCTQRPSGVIRDAVLANANLRISLRVNNSSDSTAVIGNDRAAVIPARARGRGIVALAGGDGEPGQFALAESRDIESVAVRWAHVSPVRRPWCPPLPARVPLERGQVVPGTVPFALADLPDEQRQATVSWHPETDGGLLVLGAPRSGKSTALDVLGEFGTTIPHDPAAAWDVIAELATTANALVVADDLDSLLARFPHDYRDVVVDRLAEVMRDGPRRDTVVVASAQRMTSDLQRIAPLLPARLVLHHVSRQEFVLAGGDGAHHSSTAVPGRGVWKGTSVQVMVGDHPPERTQRQPLVADSTPTGPFAIVTTRPAVLAARLTRAGVLVRGPADAAPAGRIAVIADPDQWQSRWSALGGFRAAGTLYFDACGTAEYRALTRSRELPPLMAGHPELQWHVTASGEATRVRLLLSSPGAGQASAAVSSV
jgi:S-DNA-T family DNA segregation ATPase FtsK/SpoIIIE